MRTKIGIVGSTKMTGTASVTVDRFIMHPKYNKRFRRSKKYLADLNGHTVNTGDKVEITECRPLSKNKCFKVTSVLVSAHQVSDVAEKDIAAVKREKVAPEPVAKKEEKKPASAEATAGKEEVKDAKTAETTEESTPDQA